MNILIGILAAYWLVASLPDQAMTLDSDKQTKASFLSFWTQPLFCHVQYMEVGIFLFIGICLLRNLQKKIQTVKHFFIFVLQKAM